MIQHAILIETHSNVDLLNKVIKKMYAENHYFFIHVDKKTKNYHDFLKLASTHVYFTDKRYNVRWGAVDQIYATLELINKAKSIGVNFKYYHLISGQDYPVHNNEYFDNYFSYNTNSFMELDDVSPIEPRYMYYHLNGIINVRSYFGEKIKRYSIKLQKYLSSFHRIRKPLYLKPYKGSNWWSLHVDMIDYILSYIKQHPKYLKRFRFTSCCDEVFFHTLAFNSTLKDTIIKDDLRYYDWHRTYPMEKLPRILQFDDYEKIINTNAVFCRKIDYNVSNRLIEKLDKNI